MTRLIPDRDFCLTADAKLVLDDLVSRGAVPTSGHRSIAGQARAMAVNTALNRQFIGQTYKRGAALQRLVDEHPEWVTATRLGEGLFQAMTLDPELAKGLSHHLIYPCPCFDLDVPVNEDVKARIEEYQREGVITRVLWKEGGMDKCHVECSALPAIKVEEV